MNANLINLPLEVQTTLAAGYLAYLLAYAGSDTKQSAMDVAFRTFAFGIPAVIAFRFQLPHSTLCAVVSALIASLATAAFWRKWARGWVQSLTKKLGIHGEDGFYSAWTALIQQKKLTVSQVSVHTVDGRVLYQNEHKYNGAHLDGLYFGGDGSIVMVVEEEEMPDGTTEERLGISDPSWGTRVTYIPANQIRRVNIR